jgi:hypothetical protein
MNIELKLSCCWACRLTRTALTSAVYAPAEGALHLGIDPGDRRRVRGTLQFALPQGPLDRIAGQSDRTHDHRKGRTKDD